MSGSCSFDMRIRSTRRLPQRFPVWEVRGLRERFVRADPVFTRMDVLDTEIVMVERATRALHTSAARVEWALRVLFMAVLLLVGGSLVEHFWR